MFASFNLKDEVMEIQIKYSKNKLAVPVVNNTYLHSSFNPIKEAESFIENHLTTLKEKNKILVLGLGFGYHIDQIIHHLNNFHSTYQIVVIEPNKQIVNGVKGFRPELLSKITVLSPSSPEELYESEIFVQFLMSKPGMISHPTSLNLNLDFFNRFLSYKADQSLASVINRLSAANQLYLKKYPLNSNLEDVMQAVSEKTSLDSKNDYLVMALKSLKAEA